METSKLNCLEKNITLISSMTKSEKRNFRLKSFGSETTGAYILLFDMIVNNSTGSKEEIKQKFVKKTHKNIDSASTYLYYLLLEFLVGENSKKSIKSSIFNQVEKSIILFERKLFDEGFYELEKALKKAELFEDEMLQLFIWRTKLRFHEKLDFVRLPEKELVAIQRRQLELIKRHRVIDQHKFLYDILRLRILHEGYITSEQMKNKFNDLIISELNLVSNFSLNSFEVNKQHLLFQSTYYLESGNFISAVRNFNTLIDLFENNKHLLLEPPIYYFNALVGILNTLIGIKMFNEIEHFLEKVRLLDSTNYSIDFLLQVRWIEFSTRMIVLLNRADFKKIDELNSEFEEKLLSKSHLFHPNMLIHLYILKSTCFLYQGKTKEARKILSNTITKYKVFREQPLFRQVRLIYLLLRAETEDISYTIQEIKSFKQRFKNEHASLIELLVLDFAKEFPLPALKKQREEILKRYRVRIDAALKDKYSQKLLSYFDFTLYIESCITGQTVERLISLREND